MTQQRNDIATEARLVPWWSVLLAVGGFLLMQWVFHVAILQGHSAPPPFVVRVCLGLLTGAALAFYFLFLGYVNRDAGRRGMNRALWTFIALLVPNGIGFILYFVMRKPLQLPCPHCGATVDPAATYCTACGKAVKPACAHCGAPLRPGDAFCPACGKSTTPSA